MRICSTAFLASPVSKSPVKIEHNPPSITLGSEGSAVRRSALTDDGANWVRNASRSIELNVSKRAASAPIRHAASSLLRFCIGSNKDSSIRDNDGSISLIFFSQQKTSRSLDTTKTMMTKEREVVRQAHYEPSKKDLPRSHPSSPIQSGLSGRLR